VRERNLKIPNEIRKATKEEIETIAKTIQGLMEGLMEGTIEILDHPYFENCQCPECREARGKYSGKEKRTR
jgi:hypothetical protein